MAAAAVQGARRMTHGLLGAESRGTLFIKASPETYDRVRLPCEAVRLHRLEAIDQAIEQARSG